MKVTLELQQIIYDTAKMGVMYKVNNVKFDGIVDVETILNTKLTDIENAKYAEISEAISAYFNKLAITLYPAN